MGKLRPPAAVKLITGFIYTGDVDFDQVKVRVEKEWGSMDLDSGEIPFVFTSYYEKEMGVSLLRRFCSFQNLIDPGSIPGVKLRANDVEDEFARQDKTRRLNLDPGYVEQAKLILATTKNFSHRVYIGQSIYGEVTLQWKKGRFLTLPHTYPDYASRFALDFFRKVREKYRQQLSAQQVISRRL